MAIKKNLRSEDSAFQPMDVEAQNPKLAPELDAKGFARSEYELYDDDGHVQREGGANSCSIWTFLAFGL